MLQLSPSTWIDPNEVISIVENRHGNSQRTRPTRLYLHGGRTVTVDADLQMTVSAITGARFPGAPGLLAVSPSASIDPNEVTGIVQNRSESRELRPTRVYLKGGRTITVAASPGTVVRAVQAARATASA